MLEIGKLYLKWFIPLSVISYLLVLLYPAVSAVVFGGIATFIAPVDRVRVNMLKNQQPIPNTNDALKLIAFFSVAPFIFGIYVGLTGQLPENMHRANMVVNSLLIFWGVPFVFYCIQFFSKATWLRALKKYAL
jgi:hypothetical protein